MQRSNPESLMKENAHIVSERNTEKKKKEKKSEMQSANNQRALSYSNGAAAVFGGWVWPCWFFLPPELSRLCDVRDPICSIKLCHRTGHCSVPRTKWQPRQYVHSAAHWSPTKQGSSVIWYAVRSTAQNGQAVYWREEWKTKTHIPRSHHASLWAAGRAAISVIHI